MRLSIRLIYIKLLADLIKNPQGVNELFGKKKDSRLIALEKIKKQEKKDNILAAKQLSNLRKRLDEAKEKSNKYIKKEETKD